MLKMNNKDSEFFEHLTSDEKSALVYALIAKRQDLPVDHDSLEEAMLIKYTRLTSESKVRCLERLFSETCIRLIDLASNNDK